MEYLFDTTPRLIKVSKLREKIENQVSITIDYISYDAVIGQVRLIVPDSLTTEQENDIQNIIDTCEFNFFGNAELDADGELFFDQVPNEISYFFSTSGDMDLPIKNNSNGITFDETESDKKIILGGVLNQNTVIDGTNFHNFSLLNINNLTLNAENTISIGNNLNLNSNNITNINLVDGRDLSQDGSVLDSINNSNGIIVRTGNDNFSSREIIGTNNQISISNGNGTSGNPSISISNNPILPGNSKMRPPKGTSAQRPSSPISGDFRYNTDINSLEYYNNSKWVEIPRFIEWVKDFTTSMTTSTTFKTKLTLNTSNLESGTYKIEVSYGWNNSSNNDRFESKILLNSTKIGNTHSSISSYNEIESSNYISRNFIEELTSGTHTIEVLYRTSKSNKTSKIEDVSIILEKIK